MTTAKYPAFTHYQRIYSGNRTRPNFTQSCQQEAWMQYREQWEAKHQLSLDLWAASITAAFCPAYLWSEELQS